MNNHAQSDYWNGDAGQRWVNFSSRLDSMLSPFAKLILAKANISEIEEVVDIGCGAGALSLMASKLGRSVLGVDISKPLIDLAWERSDMLPSVEFALADAGDVELDKKRDVAISRFGVMFFSDPVAAFTNIRKQLKPKGRMVFACWQSPAKNAWAKAPLEAAMPFFKEVPTPPEPNMPGPFGLENSQYLTDVLMDAGWSSVSLTDWTGDIRLPGKDAQEAAAFMMEMGPLSKIMKEQALDFEAVQTALVERLKRNANADGSIDMQGSVWIVSADKRA